jgi:hypothetical protein
VDLELPKNETRQSKKKLHKKVGLQQSFLRKDVGVKDDFEHCGYKIAKLYFKKKKGNDPK